MFHARFANGNPQKQREEQRRSNRKQETENSTKNSRINPEKPDVPLNKNDAFQKVQKRHVQEKR